MSAETYYQTQLELVRKIYVKFAVKDVSTMIPEELEEYRYHLDLTRWARAALESNRPVEQKLAELKLALSRPTSH